MYTTEPIPPRAARNNCRGITEYWQKKRIGRKENWPAWVLYYSKPYVKSSCKVSTCYILFHSFSTSLASLYREISLVETGRLSLSKTPQPCLELDQILLIIIVLFTALYLSLPPVCLMILTLRSRRSQILLDLVEYSVTSFRNMEDLSSNNLIGLSNSATLPESGTLISKI